jgi:hypothetical protein
MMPDCRREFIPDFLRANFTNNFLTHKLRTRQTGILANISANYMPQTQQVISIQDTVRTTHAKIQAYAEEMRQLQQKVNELHAEINFYNNNIGQITNGKKPVAYTFTQKCPVDDCAGYLATDDVATTTDTIKYCSLCKKHTCIECNATVTCPTDVAPVKGDTPAGHKCDPEARRTLAEIRKHAKPCPKCGVYISKTEGCNDMFCSLCNTAFRYDTGVIQTRNSNPLYAEYVRRMGTARATDDVAAATTAATPPQCVEITQDIVSLMEARLMAMVKIKKTSADTARVIYMSNAILHIVNLIFHCETRRREIFRFHERLESLYNTREAYNLRLSFLNKQTNEIQYNAELYTMCKTNNKNRDYATILDMYSQSLRDILLEFYQYIMSLPLTRDSFQLVLQWGFYTKLTTLTDYTNNCFKQTAKNYGTSPKCCIFLYVFREFDKTKRLHHRSSYRWNTQSSGMWRYTKMDPPGANASWIWSLYFHPTLCEGSSVITSVRADIDSYILTPDDITTLEAIGEYVFDNVPMA